MKPQKIWNKLSLRGRIYTTLIALVSITLIGAMVTVWYTYRIERVLNAIISRNLAAYQAAVSLETALVSQKGFVSYYVMDGDPDWLRQLGEHRQMFKERLKQARILAENKEQERIIHQIELKYTNYTTLKDRVITLYKAKKHEAGKRLHYGVRNQFFDTFSLCESYKNIHLKRITQARLESQNQAENLRIIALAAILAVLLFASSLAFFLTNQILGPVRKLSMVAVREGGSNKPVNEIQALSHGVHDLIEDIDQTYSELEKSREHLLQAEKMALVGKLAAGMAHSIRNPFTSVKMRLFSLERSLKMSETQKDDLKVISEEIRHIDTIVQNFLEFSRPPKLKTQGISPSTVVDSAVQLLEHRLKSYDVGIQIIRSRPLPEIMADPEQLKEVLANLVVNACEAMENGGSIVIREEVFAEPLKKMVALRLSDNGPGIPAALGYKIFQPFFTTKEEGTGLGLSIAARIIEEHQGRLDVDSEEGNGATFIITLPVKE